MIETDKYEGHDTDKRMKLLFRDNLLHIGNELSDADYHLLADAPLLLEFIQKIVKDWCKPNQCNQSFGKDVRQLMYEYGLITFNEETRRYEVKIE